MKWSELNIEETILSAITEVFRFQDLTPVQQAESKRLRQILKERRDKGEDVVIFRNKITKRDDIKNFR